MVNDNPPRHLSEPLVLCSQYPEGSGLHENREEAIEDRDTVRERHDNPDINVYKFHVQRLENPDIPRSKDEAHRDAEFHVAQLVDSLQDAGVDIEIIEKAEKLLGQVAVSPKPDICENTDCNSTEYELQKVLMRENFGGGIVYWCGDCIRRDSDMIELVIGGENSR